MKLGKSIALAIFLLTWSSVTWAADNLDASRVVLNYIFGAISDAPQNVSLMGLVFQKLNTFVVSIGSFFIIYNTSLGLFHTAHSGTPFGQKMHSLFMPARLVFGSASLIPNSNGYSVLQIVMMKLILLGITGANMVWDYALTDFFHKGGQIDQGSSITHQIDDALTNNIREKYILPLSYPTLCMAAVNSKKNIFGGKYINIDKTVMPIMVKTTKNGKNSMDVYFTTTSDITQDPVCGKVSLYADNDTQESYLPELEVAVMSAINELNQAAINFFNDKTNLINQYNTNPYYIPAAIINLANKLDNNYNNVRDYIFLENYIHNIENIVQSFVAKVSNIKTQMQNSLDSNLDGKYQQMLANGWMTAGFYYYDLSKANEDHSPRNVVNNYLDTLQYDASSSPYSDYVDNTKLSKGTFSVNDDKVLQQSLYSLIVVYAPKVANLITNAESGNASCKNPLSISNPLKQTKFAKSHQFTDSISKEMNNHLCPSSEGGLLSKLKNLNKSHPLLTASETGFFLGMGAEIGLVLLGVGASVITGFAVAASLFEGGATAAGISTLLKFVTPILIAAFTAIEALSVTLNVYIPLIPAIIFTSAIVGWMIICVEAMAAAPLLALGILAPDGEHELYGRAAPAILMALNVVVRPVLMIIGFVAAMQIVRIALVIVQYVFWDSLTGWGPGAGSGSLGNFVAFIFAWVAAIAAITNKVFGLVTHVPDRAINWIGGQAMGPQDNITGEIQAAAGRGGDYGTRVSSEASQKGSAMTSGYIDKKVEDNKKSPKPGDDTTIGGS